MKKRKRGRPRKLYNSMNEASKKFSDTNDYHRENEVKTDTLQGKSVCSTIFKRRLRRRSIKITCSDPFLKKSNNDDTCTIKLPLDTNAANGNKINTKNLNKEMTKINCIKKRKRGRPSKLTTIIETCKEYINEKNSNYLSGTIINTHNIEEYSNPKVIIEDNLSSKIDDIQSPQKNNRRQPKIILPSNEFHNKIVHNESQQELHNSNFNNSIISTLEECSENEDNKQHTDEKNLSLIYTQKKRGRPSKLKIPVSGTLINKQDMKDIYLNEQNNYKMNKSNKFCITSEISSENNEQNINKSILTNKQSLDDNSTIKKYVYTEIQDSTSDIDKKNEKCLELKVLNSVSTEKIDKRVIPKKADNYLDLKTSINNHDSLNDNSIKSDGTSNEYVNKEITVPCNIQKRRRGRPSKFKTHGCNISNAELVSDDSKPNDIKNIVDETGLSDSCNTSNDNESNSYHRKKRKCPFNINKERKRGRPRGGNRKSYCDDDYVPHHSQLHQSLKKENRKLNSVESSMKKVVSCGKCDMEILKSQWSHHNLTLHNDLGWLKGTTKPDFENDEKLLKRILFNAIKRRKGNLICEICNVIKRSVLGFLSHTTFCGKDEEEKRALMVTCPICDAVTKPSSLEYHERMHKIQLEENKKTNYLEAENINLGSKIKRKAAEKAITKISEFTAIVNDKDDKDCSFSQDKKLKLNFSSVKKLIQKPQLIKKIPSILLGKWKQNLNIGQHAICNQAGCQFNSKSLNEIKKHYSACNFTPQQNFLCKICQFQTLSEHEIVNHALQKHSTEDSYDTNISMSDTESSSSDNIELDNESEKNPGLPKKFSLKKSIKSSNKIFRFLFKDGVSHTKLNKPFYAAFQWTLEFERKNYKFNLFKELVPNTFKLLSIKESKEYFPDVEQSMPMKNEKTNNEDSMKSKWKKWKRFEGHCVQDNPTFFAGGPVWALAWLPIPSSLAFSKNISQFIATSTHPTMDVEFSIGKTYTKKNIIQIWNFGDLDNKSSNMYNPKLAYAIAHEGGTVWCLDWCPSGCYQHEQLPGFINKNDQPKRMGLLAAACSDGCVRIYSLIFPEDLPSYTDCNKAIDNFDDDKIMENVYPIYNTDPVLKLIINLEMYDQKQQIWQVTKLSWSKENEHNIIVAGFSNGYIALWDLTSKSPMLKCKRGNTVFLNSYRHFFAHHHAITMVYLIPQDNKRFLATASLDRHYKFWDLEDITNPRNSLKKSFVTDGSWLNNWHCALVAYDDALSMNHSYSYCLPLREYTYKYYNLLPTNSTSYTISTSDFGNSIANGTLAGEVLAIFPEQLLYIRDMDKTLPRKRHNSIVSSLELIDFQSDPKGNESVQIKKREKNNENLEYNYMPSTYNDSKDRFGLKFCDKMNFFRDEYASKHLRNHKKTLTCEMMKNVPIEQYPFMSVNRLAWNPNAWSFLWLAVGYQNGFVRLISFKSLASTECNKLLISHIETMKSKK